MKRRHKVYLKLNLMSLIFVVVSFISVTLAWFAYSGLSSVSTEIGVKAWYIELEKDGEAVKSNDIVISLSEIYPGMETVDEIVKLKNLGDSDAQVKYEISSARILSNEEDNYIINGTTITSEYVEDKLSHEYPFHVNINLNKKIIVSSTGEATFEVSISWPLDSGDNELDSYWGNEAYTFQKDEETKRDLDPNYIIRPSVEVIIRLSAEQYIESATTSDPRYNLGDEILFNVVDNQRCSEVNATCIKTNVIDVNNTIGDNTVTLLPSFDTTHSSDIYTNYNSALSSITTGWNVTTRPLLVDDILNIISTDIITPSLIRSGISDSIIGNLNYDNRISTELLSTISYTGYYKFLNSKFNYFVSNNCYWTDSEYDQNNAFAYEKVDETNSKIYGKLKSETCMIVPVIIVNKTNL